MQTPLQIAFQDIAPSPTLEAAIREKVAKLEHFHGRMTSCRVVVALPHRSKRQGTLYNIRIDITVPGGGEIVVNREPGLDHAHEDVYVALRDAFDSTRRQLQDYVRRRRDDVKEPEAAGPQ
jgi:ribosomal subunit interface protein